MFLLELANLGEGFKKYFEVMPALTDELRDHVYRIRHEVYCAELKYEPVRPDGREPDDYDAHALHCLIRSVHTGDYVGCTRLVLARPGDPSYPLPMTMASILDGLNFLVRPLYKVVAEEVLAGIRAQRGSAQPAKPTATVAAP
jgi:N-acyl amino acid synthase of PEP-CTERM/exosortase system